MKADAFLSRLEKVRRTGNGTWVACCPSHADKTPSLSVREEGEMVLVHCFGGCAVAEVLASVGLDFDALFPDKPIADHVKPLRRPFPAADVLECVSTETEIVAVAAGNLAQGVALTDADRARLFVAAGRVEEARRLALG